LLLMLLDESGKGPGVWGRGLFVVRVAFRVVRGSRAEEVSRQDAKIAKGRGIPAPLLFALLAAWREAIQIPAGDGEPWPVTRDPV
jgi:hypothetical protein